MYCNNRFISLLPSLVFSDQLATEKPAQKLARIIHFFMKMSIVWRKNVCLGNGMAYNCHMEEDLAYERVASRGARRMSIVVQPGGKVIVRAPRFMPETTIQKFVREKSTWIQKHQSRMRHIVPLPGGRKSYLTQKERARALVQERVVHWNKQYGFSYGRISIKNTKHTWGSCSKRGNLNFNFAVVFLPPELVDYVIVHELCHLKEHNHSVAFWNLVAQAMPNYMVLRRALRRYAMYGIS